MVLEVIVSELVLHTIDELSPQSGVAQSDSANESAAAAAEGR